MVSISLVINEGIIGKSKHAVDKYSEEEEKEMIGHAYSEYQMAKYSGQTLSLDQALANSGLTGASSQEITGGWTITVGDKIYNLAVDGTVTPNSSSSGQGSGTGGTTQAIGTITSANYGDYIDLGQDVVKTSATTDDWRILYNDTTNNVVYAILADYLPNNNAAVTAAGLDKDGTYAVLSNAGKATLLAGLNHTTAWNSLIPTTLVSSGASVRGAVTGEMLLASWNEKYGTNFSITDYPSFITDPHNFNSIDELYMPHPSTNENCYGYWLSSPGNDDSETVWFVSRRRFVYR